MTDIYTTDELLALHEFRRAIGDLLEDFEDEHDLHDTHLIRWLRARELNVTKAEILFRKSMIYRKEHELDTLKHLPIPEHMLEKLAIRPLGFNKQGCFVASINAAQWEFKALVLAGKNEEIETYVCQVLEKLFQFKKSTCSPENIIYHVVFIADFQGFSIPEHLKKPVISFAIQLLMMLDLNYPEMLKTVFAINVPPLFQVAWSIISPFLSTHTVKKFKFIRGGADKWKKALLEDIDAHELPAEFGGTNTAHPFGYNNSLGFSWPTRATPFPTTSFISTVVPAKDKFIQSYELGAGKRISWNFKTDLYDIGFEFTFDGVGMFPYARADAHLNVQDGLVDVLQNGTYSLVFDNSYSKYRSKTLHYAVSVEASPVVN